MPVTVISNFDLDANGCGFPVPNHMGLIVKIVFLRSIVVGALCNGD